ncbi:MAG: XdhC family protein [Anaerolineae bacterium]|nr:XdhC family protein [Gemmatimonadaceae bacterium]
MEEFFAQLDLLRATERRVAMATLVATRGTTPKKEGAKMWVGEGGRILGSVTIGGCVDARVIAESEEVLASAKPKLLSMSLGDDEAWDLGLTCGGTIDVLLEAIDFDRQGDSLLSAYDAVRADEEPERQAVVVIPLPEALSRLVVFDDGAMSGTLGNVALDKEARAHALKAMLDGRSRTVTLRAEEAEHDVFLELLAPPPTLVIFGATHIAMPLVSFARGLGWKTIVVDGRERFATPARFPDAHEIRVGVLGDIAAEMAFGASTFVVLTAHDYKYELPVLRTILAKEPAYIGLLGSARRGAALRDFLRSEGMSDADMGRIRVPVGLDIGADSAAEIALSILAEAVAVRTGRPGTPMKDRQGSNR